MNTFCPLADEHSALLENTEFLAEGGTLGLDLRIARALGFQPVLYLYYHQVNGDLPEGWTHRIFATCHDLALGYTPNPEGCTEV